jgi:hypothetical protein
MRKVYRTSLGMLLAALAAPGLAQAPAAAQSQAAPATAASTAAPAADPNEIICQKIEQLGSRIAKKRVCMTRAEWADQQLQDRQAIEKAQIQRTMSGE